MISKPLCDDCLLKAQNTPLSQGHCIRLCSECDLKAAVDYVAKRAEEMGEGLIKTPKYSIEVYEDHAITRGCISSEMLVLLIRLCKKEGFIYITAPDDGTRGFKLVKK